MMIDQPLWTERTSQDVVGVYQQVIVSDFGTVLVSTCTRLGLEPYQIHCFLWIWSFVL